MILKGQAEVRGEVKSATKIFDSVEKRLVVPVYQRNYDWSRKQCERLFDDLEDLITQGRPKHFFGSIVGNPETSFLWVVIDGQQRLTTLSLLMLALTRALDAGVLETKDKDLANRIRRSFLLISEKSGETKFKLKPVKNDADAYRRLFSDEKYFVEDSNLTSNYRYFIERLARTSLTGDEVWNAIESLDLMILDLEAHDDPQRIFESLNSTGLALSEADKIRNLVLMGQDSDTQEYLYENYWNVMERNVNYRTDWFIRWYLTIRLSRTPNQNAVYDEFKSLLSKRKEPVAEILRELHDYSELFREIDHPSTGNQKLDRVLGRFNLIRGDVLIPLILPLYREMRQGKLSVGEFSRIIRVLETHVFRRTIASVGANSLNKIYATVYNEVRKLRREGDSTLDIVIYLLRRRDHTSGRIPDDEEFSEAFASRNMFRLHKATTRYLFDVLENGDSNDTKDIATALENQAVSIEHIMPQTLSLPWREDLGEDAEEVHRTWLNRIGNLTVTGYNSSYSNLPFLQKRDRENGLRETAYRLNNDIRDCEVWNEVAMRHRTDVLLADALNYWCFPETSFEPVRVAPLTEPMGDDTDFTGRAVAAFEYEGVKVPVRTWAELMPRFLRVLLDEHRSEIINYANTESSALAVLNPDQATPPGVAEVDSALGVQIWSSTWSKVKELRKLFDYLGLDTEELVFTLRRNKDEVETEETVTEASPYEDLISFQELIDDEFSAPNITPVDTESLRNQFVEAFKSHRPVEPLAALNGANLQSLKTSAGAAEATPEQILAAIALTIDTPAMYAPHALHDSMAAGEISRWLESLADAGFQDV